DADAGAVVRSLMPAVNSARAAARRAKSQNNMKQIALAMHNYHDANGHFPPAVGRSPDGKVAYSWRVALLPYLGQEALYKQYDFTEPGDSPKNRKVLAQVPDVYRYPSDETPDGPLRGVASDRAGYFVVTGPSTLFPPDSPGVKIADITDGTSNTAMLVEAK